ncbi:cation transporter [Vogesella fluminis]
MRTPIRIMQMDCPTEEVLIRKKLGGMDTVKSLEFNLMQRVLTVVHTPGSLESVLEAVRTLGFTPSCRILAASCAPAGKRPSRGGRWRWPA